LHGQVQVESAALRCQRLDHILDAQAERFLFDEIGRDNVKEVCFSDLSLVASIEVFLHVIDLSFNQPWQYFFK
jgi:hypothetical protein